MVLSDNYRLVLLLLAAVCILILPVSATVNMSYYTPTYTNASWWSYSINYTGNGCTTWVAPTGITSIDVFLVGGGGGGSAAAGSPPGSGGGGGGYTATYTNVPVTPGNSYTIIVGAGQSAPADTGICGQGGQSVFDALRANGGLGGCSGSGANGGSGGGSMGHIALGAGGAGGTNGGDGVGIGSGYNGGTGQGYSTKEFNVSDARLFSGGGGGGLYTPAGSAGNGGAGGGGAGGTYGNYGVAGTSGLGGGGGGTGGDSAKAGTAGGDGYVAIRYNTTSSSPDYSDASSTIILSQPALGALESKNLTVSINNLSIKQNVTAVINFDKLHLQVDAVSANTSSGISSPTTSWSIDNTTGQVKINVSAASISTTSLIPIIDILFKNYNYSANSTYPVNASPARYQNLTGNAWYNFAFNNPGQITNGWTIAADFSCVPTSGYHPLSVTCTDASTGYPTIWNWSFGDGNYSSEQNPTHLYELTGQFTVSLNASISNTTFDVETKSNYINATYPYTVPIFSNTTGFPLTGQLPFTARFTDSSTGSPAVTAWLWDFGDGDTTNNTEQNPIHTYANYGTYNVGLRATNTYLGNWTNKTGYVTVIPAAVTGDFVGYPSLNGTRPLNVAFVINTSGSRVDTWYWQFGDYNTSASQNPVHLYEVWGLFNVQVIARNTTLGNTTFTKNNYVNVTVPPPPAAAFTNTTGFPLTGQSPHTIRFTDQSQATIVSWLWDFGDGDTTNNTEQNPIHTYTTHGTYSINLTVTNTSGSDYEYKSNYVTVIPAAVTGDFVGYPALNGTRPLNVAFVINTSGSLVDSWYWQFGDYNTSTSQNPVHLYEVWGLFNVQVIARNTTLGNTTFTKNNYVNVTVPEPITGDFVGYPALNGTRPLNVAFVINTSGSRVDSWYWQFGDYNTSTNQNPVHLYEVTGQHTVSVIAKNGTLGNTTFTKNNYINVTYIPPLTADFTSNVTTGHAPLGIQFNDTTIGSPTGWNWSFGDGSYSDLQNPDHTYTAFGTFTVALTVVDGISTDTKTKTGYITVTELLITHYTANTTFGQVPLVVRFTDLSNNATAWNWSFGDGNTSVQQNPVFTYNIPGVYNVTLTVTNGIMSNSSSRLLITAAYINGSVTPTPTPTPAPGGLSANFIGFPTSGGIPLSVSFADLSSGSPIAWNWSFGDGTNSTSQNPSHTYTTTGLYNIFLNITDGANTSVSYRMSYINATNATTPTPTPTGTVTPIPTTGIPEPLAAKEIEASVGETWIEWTWTWNMTNTTPAVYVDGERVYNLSGNRILVSGLDPRSYHTFELYVAENNSYVKSSDITTLPSSMDIMLYFIVSIVITLTGLFALTEPEWKILFAGAGLAIALYGMSVVYGLWFFLNLLAGIFAGVVMIYYVWFMFNQKGIGKW